MANETKKNNNSATAVAVAGAAGLAVWLATRKPAATGTGIPQSLLDQVADIDTVKMVELIAAIKAMSINVQGFAPNADLFVATRVPLILANVAIQLSDLSVMDDFSLMLKADPTNPVNSVVRVASTRADAQGANGSYPLVPNEFRTFKIRNASQLYVSASAVPAWVIVSTERNI
jgi:hypothetical protein